MGTEDEPPALQWGLSAACLDRDGVRALAARAGARRIRIVAESSEGTPPAAAAWLTGATSP